ncbi:hypothetical protein B0H10DRAFT_2323329 [Mycena sp. CBHHK59/15]|nr:hypothetical protein B0H10DRAFT_2323329 [Mycena sp. CBHHK59/15]
MLSPRIYHFLLHLFSPPPCRCRQIYPQSETRRIAIPPHRMTPLKKEWINIFGPLTEILGLQVRMNVQRKCVEARTSKATKDIGALQKGADFVKAFALGFDVNDAIALLRLDDLYLDSFEIKDVKHFTATICLAHWYALLPPTSQNSRSKTPAGPVSSWQHKNPHNGVFQTSKSHETLSCP